MSFQTWPEVVASAQGDGTAVTNSTTPAFIQCHSARLMVLN